VNPVVIVETEDVVRDAVADVLRDAGIEVVALANGWDIFLLSEETVPLVPNGVVHTHRLRRSRSASDRNEQKR
jgi:hypothetical protein